jgi:trehalose 6-phosphate phosphatase
VFVTRPGRHDQGRTNHRKPTDTIATVSANGIPAAIFDPLFVDPARSGLFCDFDGTLSEIVDEPRLARPLHGAAEALADLATTFGRVGVISGRPIEFVRAYFPPSIQLAGLYGLEAIIDGHRVDHPQGHAWREVVDDVVSSSIARGPRGMSVENKGLSLTLHFRTAPQIGAEVEAWAVQQAARSGLLMRPARMSFELHPPIQSDKGTALFDLASGCSAVGFAGDDVGDIPAFDALDELAHQSIPVVRIAVGGAEESAELIARADVRVEGPAGVVDVLDYLCARARRLAS